MELQDSAWKCKECGKVMSPKDSRPMQLYCSEACARKAHRKNEYNKLDKKRRTLSLHDKLAVYLTYNNSCAICGFSLAEFINQYSAALQYSYPDTLRLLQKKSLERFKRDLNGANGGCEIHHIVPIADGGDNSKGNLILLCPNCHKQVHFGIISKDRLAAYRVNISDEDLELACRLMIMDVQEALRNENYV